jgi:maltose alpha-D-glucosyltransferase/alpha-amylase
MVESAAAFVLEDDPTWYKDAIIYEVHVRAFYDSNADGIGDFQGLTEKLDYLQDLGITALWVLPFYPSPLKDDGYDIADYTDVNPSYGTLADFKVFLREAHRRGIRVITELVLNHTSDQHSWFQRARRAKPGSSWRDFYVWSNTSDKYREARIIFKDFENSNWTWDPIGNAYYWHRFYHHQPDLNFENPEVRKSLFQVVNFWLGMGVDGMRLDAVPYLYEREGSNCENLPETHGFLRQLRRQVDQKFRNRMLLAEANQWPEDAVAYFGDGDECQMAFHFPVMPRMFMSLRMEDRFPILDILAQTPAIPENCQWAMFLRNHDELTLEMVTDEERDYMYRAYAHDPQMRVNLGIRRRLGTLLGHDWRQIELMNALLFSLPGTPVLYYGDEIGMGDNIYLGDRNSVRTPMQWSADRNAGFSRTSPHRLFLPIIIDPESHFEAVNVEAQQNNPHSMLWWMKRLIAMRKRYKAFGRGSLEFLLPDNHRVLAFIRRYQDETVLVVANLSRFVQYAGVDLSEFKGITPVELFGRTEFPAISEAPYALTLGGHSFYWFVLSMKAQAVERRHSALAVAAPWTGVFKGRSRTALEEALLTWLPARRWFRGKGRQIKSVSFVETATIPVDASEACLAQIVVDYTQEDPERYLLPLSFAWGDRAAQLRQTSPGAILTELAVTSKDKTRNGVVFDGIIDKDFCATVLEMILRKKQIHGRMGDFVAKPGASVRNTGMLKGSHLEVTSMRAEQTNSSIVYGDRFILKLFRQLEDGINPDLEVGRFLSERVKFPWTPAVAGEIEYRSQDRRRFAVGILEDFVPNEGDAWQHSLDALSQYFDRAVTRQQDALRSALPRKPLVDLLCGEDTPLPVDDLIGPYYESVKILGRRTAEMHLALASSEGSDFVPEPFSVLYQRSVYQSMRNHAGQTNVLLRQRLKTLPSEIVDDALKLVDRHHDVLNLFKSVLSRKITAKRTRIHGDYHLGQVLYTGKDYVIIDFEGEPARPLTERRIKRSPVRDVAGMLRSFHYAAYTSLFGQLGSAMVRPEDLAVLEPWARLWIVWIGSAFLKTYLDHAMPGGFLPVSRDELKILLNIYLLEKALYELGYELNNRPDWVRIPLTGVIQLLEESNS